MNPNNRKSEKSLIAIFVIVLVVYIIAFFVIPFNRTAASRISFTFSIVAVVSSILAFNRAFNAKEMPVSKLYGYPIFRVGMIYVLVQLVVSISVCVIETFILIPYWIALILSVLFLGAATIGMIITDNVRDVVEAVDAKFDFAIKQMTSFQISIADIVDQCKDEALRVELKKLDELFRYSDPISSEDTRESEQAIQLMLDELKVLVPGGSADEIAALTEKITTALKIRNRICKASKK